MATREGAHYRLDGALETKLRTLQLRRDILRTLNQRRLESGRPVQALGAEAVRGVVVRTGFHDEAGAAPWVIVRDRNGSEHYARLGAETSTLKRGATVTLALQPGGLARVLKGRGADLER